MPASEMTERQTDTVRILVTVELSNPAPSGVWGVTELGEATATLGRVLETAATLMTEPLRDELAHRSTVVDLSKLLEGEPDEPPGGLEDYVLIEKPPPDLSPTEIREALDQLPSAYLPHVLGGDEWKRFQMKGGLWGLVSPSRPHRHGARAEIVRMSCGSPAVIESAVEIATSAQVAGPSVAAALAVGLQRLTSRKGVRGVQEGVAQVSSYDAVKAIVKAEHSREEVAVVTDMLDSLQASGFSRDEAIAQVQAVHGAPWLTPSPVLSQRLDSAAIAMEVVADHRLSQYALTQLQVRSDAGHDYLEELLTP